MKNLIIVAVLMLIFTSCADSKEFTIDNNQVVVEPYGWFDTTQRNGLIPNMVMI